MLASTPVEMRLLHPHIAPDGSRLLWSELIAGRSGPEVQWAAKIPSFNHKQNAQWLADTPRQPLGSVFYESHGWSPDSKGIVFSARLLPHRRQDEATTIGVAF
jgi:hypothetical protein